MEEQLRQLISLQQIDLEIGEIQDRVTEQPERFAGIDLEIEEAQQSYGAFLKELEDLKKVRRTLEKEIEEVDQRIKKSRVKLMEVKNNKEYKAMLTEIDELSKGKETKEDRLLELMDKWEHLNNQSQEHKITLEAKIAEGKSRKAELEKDKERYALEMSRLETRRREVESLIDRPHLEKYEFLRDRLKGLAMAEARQGACLVCHMHIPPQMYNELQRNDRLITCPSCYRILYFGGRDEASKS